MATLTELQGRLEEIRSKAAKVFEEAGPDLDMAKVTSIDGDSAAKASQLKAWNDEMTDLGEQIDEQKTLHNMRVRTDELGELEEHIGHPDGSKSRNGGRRRQDDDHNGGVAVTEQKGLGDLFVESAAFKNYQPGSKRSETATFADFELKNTFSTTAGWAPADIRGPRVVDYATRPLMVAELLPQSTTTAAAVVYMEETLFSNSAAEVAEGAEKP
jgi:hypothetical protein